MTTELWADPVEGAERWYDPSAASITLPATGLEVTQLIVDYAFTLVFEDHSQLRIESPFHFKANAQDAFLIEMKSTEFAPLLPLFSAQVLEMISLRSAQLSLTFQNGDQMTVASDPDYEAWNFTTLRGESLVALPGGGVAYFPEKSARS